MFFTADLDRWISNLQYLLKRLLLFTGSVKAWVSTTLCPLSGHFQEVDDLLDLNPTFVCSNGFFLGKISTTVCYFLS